MQKVSVQRRFEKSFHKKLNLNNNINLRDRSLRFTNSIL